MDWASLIPAAITGVVGLGGIGGTLWEGKRTREAAFRDLESSLATATQNANESINAEDRRAYVAEKRRAYSALNAAIEHLWFVVTSSQDFTTEPGRSNYNEAMDALWGTCYAVQLIAPASVYLLAREITDMLTAFGAARVKDREASRPRRFDSKREQLVRDMRADLDQDEPLSREEAVP
jgi:hypothetical protein